jgi:threonylcarbamoyladenosine tRNA methylthiotransferase MtaB
MEVLDSRASGLASGERGPRVAFRTLGCRLNQYETEALASEFTAAGYRVVPFGEPAEVQVINTCTITNQADRKSRNLIYRALRTVDAELHRPGGATGRGGEPTVVVTGCFAERKWADLDEDDRVVLVDNDSKSDILSVVEALLRGEVTPPRRDRFGFRPSRAVYHTRAAVKIQDGCDRHCTYCIVPRVRGRAVSRSAADVLAEIRSHIEAGYREVVLTGVNLGRYRSAGIDFPGLVSRALEEITTGGRVAAESLASSSAGGLRVRISSLEPDGLDARFASLFSDPRLLPHVHLCLQSGSDRILRRMGRRYRVDDFRALAAQLRDVAPGINITTDIIAGFPGETDEDFTASLEVAREIGFSHIHAFTFSPREGTPAARMDGRVDGRVAAERSRALRELSEELKLRYYRSLVGAEEDVLLEDVAAKLPAGALESRAAYGDTGSPDRERACQAGGGGIGGRGYGRRYVPVIIPCAGLEANRVYRVQLWRVVNGDGGPVLVGRPL